MLDQAIVLNTPMPAKPANPGPSLAAPMVNIDQTSNNDKKTQESLIEKLHEENPKAPLTEKTKNADDYLLAFINNKLVRKVVPDMINVFNIFANGTGLLGEFVGFHKPAQQAVKHIAGAATKGFMLLNSFINIVERVFSKNYLSAFGYFNDILVASFVSFDNMYLARGFASGTYNIANALTIANKRQNFNSLEDHAQHILKASGKFLNNLFSKNVVKNFLNYENAMFATVGGILSNIGPAMWCLGSPMPLATAFRDVGGVMMDVEQLTPGHLNSGRKHYFWSGASLAAGTVFDFLSRTVKSQKEKFLYLTFIFDGIGRHLLRLHQNTEEKLSELAEKRQKNNEAGFALAA